MQETKGKCPKVKAKGNKRRHEEVKLDGQKAKGETSKTKD